MPFGVGVTGPHIPSVDKGMPLHRTGQHRTAPHHTAQHSTAQHSTAQHSTVQHSTAQHSTAQRSTAPHHTAQHSTAQHHTAQHSTAQHSTAQHSTAQHSTAQHSTAQHSTTQHSTAQHTTAQHTTAQHSTAPHSTAQHSTAQHSTAQHSTAQHSTAPHSTAQHSTTHSTAQHSTAPHSTLSLGTGHWLPRGSRIGTALSRGTITVRTSFSQSSWLCKGSVCVGGGGGGLHHSPGPKHSDASPAAAAGHIPQVFQAPGPRECPPVLSAAPQRIAHTCHRHGHGRVVTPNHCRGRGLDPSDVLERPYTVGRGTSPDPPYLPPLGPPPPLPPPLVMFEAESKFLLRRLRCQEDLGLKIFRPAFGGDHRGTLGGGGVRPNPPSPPPFRPPPPSNTSLLDPPNNTQPPPKSSPASHCRPCAAPKGFPQVHPPQVDGKFPPAPPFEQSSHMHSPAPPRPARPKSPQHRRHQRTAFPLFTTSM